MFVHPINLILFTVLMFLIFRIAVNIKHSKATNIWTSSITSEIFFKLTLHDTLLCTILQTYLHQHQTSHNYSHHLLHYFWLCTILCTRENLIKHVIQRNVKWITIQTMFLIESHLDFTIIYYNINISTG